MSLNPKYPLYPVKLPFSACFSHKMILKRKLSNTKVFIYVHGQSLLFIRNTMNMKYTYVSDKLILFKLIFERHLYINHWAYELFTPNHELTRKATPNKQNCIQTFHFQTVLTLERICISVKCIISMHVN